MAIEFVVETGEGLDDSTSYIDETYYKQYWENRGVSISITDDEIKTLLNRSTQTLDGRYCFEGCVRKRDQALQFPRFHIYDRNDYPIKSNIVPEEVEKATAEIALAIYNNDQDNGGTPTDPNAQPSGITSKRLGPMSISYGGNSSNIVGLSFSTADDYLDPLTEKAKRL